MRPIVVSTGQHRSVGCEVAMINPKDIYKATDGKIYSFSGYGGVENCSQCDDFNQVNEYDREDGLVVWFCKKCEDRLHL
jgi:hypothetical protein